MPLNIDRALSPAALVAAITRMFKLSAAKIQRLEKRWNPADGTPVFTVKGRYTTRGWTEWTQGFQFGAAILQYDATGDAAFLELGRRATVARMASHVSHTGVHDHGFNNISTYGNLLRLLREGRLPADEREKDFYELALKVSGAVQAARWTQLADGTGFIHSFNGPHSLFVDTIRSLRVLLVAHRLGHVLMGEQDAKISLPDRAVQHALNTARYNVYYGEGRDAYDVRGRTSHEAVFNTVSGDFRCPNSQQGYSPFSTWTRGLAWALCGFAELLEFFGQWPPTPAELPALGALLAPPLPRLAREPAGWPAAAQLRVVLAEAATATADFYLAHCCADGVPMWDTGAPNLHRLPDEYLDRPSDPFNAWEPVDSSAAAIAAQGLIRLGNVLAGHGTGRSANRRSKIEDRKSPPYRAAGLTILRTLLAEPYLSADPKHEGLLLHSVYHRPNGWDHVAPGQQVPNGESSMWGDYHLRELALLVLREAQGGPYLTFFGGVPPA